MEPDPMNTDAIDLTEPIDVTSLVSDAVLESMRDKVVLFIGGGAYSKRDVWPDASDYGVKVVLVDADADHLAKPYVYKYIQYDYTDHQLDNEHAVAIVAILKEQNITVDGCLSIWEDCGPLAAYICEYLNLNGVGLVGALNAKSKTRTQAALKEKSKMGKPANKAIQYSSATHPIKCLADLYTIPETFPFPAILKLDYGSGAVGTMMVDCIHDVIEKFQQFTTNFQSDKDYAGVGLGHGNNMVLMEYLSGSEHDVDIVIYKHKMVAAFISDNGPTRKEVTLCETGACMPSQLSIFKRESLVHAAFLCCTEIGLNNGVFNVEFKYTPMGPKLVEINGRMGGFYLRNWTKLLYNADLLMCAMMVACGLHPYIDKSAPVGQLCGIMCIPSCHRHVLEDPDYFAKLKQLNDAGEIFFNQLDEHVPEVIGGQEEPYANVAVIGGDIADAKAKLMKVAKALKIDMPEYQVQTLIEFCHSFD